MSFNENNMDSRVFRAGDFLAHEECVRETRQMLQANGVNAETGGKYIPMGTAYPSNDGNAIGIVFQDTDVTTGDMPGSVVTKGVVYEDKLAVTAESYDAVTPSEGDSPKEEGWYERSGTAGNYVYTLSTDTEVAEGKTYYEFTVTRLSSAAKSALQSKGFTFVTTPTVERPY